MTKNYELFLDNIKRVDSLCSVYDVFNKSDVRNSSKDYKSTDILRAATIILHSSFENYYREIVINQIIKNKKPEVVKQYTLPGLDKQKFGLDDLLKYSNKTANELIEDSIRSSLELISFNSYSQIVSNAAKAEIDLSMYKMQREIDTLIERRHKIVHEADLLNGRLRQIKLDQLNNWKVAVMSIVELIDKQIDTE